MIYSISYDLNSPGQKYQDLYDAIKATGDWCRYLDSAWFVDTNMSAKTIFDQLQPHLDDNDNVFIARVPIDYYGWLPQKVWDWLNARKHKMAA